MLVRATDVGDEGVLRAGVCIVGAGPAGLALAGALVEHGLDVLVLEAADPAVPRERLETVRSVGLDYAVPTKRGRGLGGGALTWNLRTPVGEPYLRLRELDELDLQRRPGVRDVGWPLSLHDLDRPYRDAWALFGMPDFHRGGTRRPADDDPRPAPEPGPGPPAAESEMRIFGLGPAATFTAALPRLLADHPAVRVVTGAVVTDVRTDGDLGAVSSLSCVTPAGRMLSVRAEVHVLAGGGIENARLLLASRSRHTAGLGNAHDHVGRYFMEHPHLDAALVRPADHRVEEDPALWDVHASRGMAVQRKYGLVPAALEREGLLSSAFYVVPRRPGKVVLPSPDGGLDRRRTAVLRAWRRALRRGELPARPWATAGDLVRSLPEAGRYVRTQARAARAVRQGEWLRTAPRFMTVRVMSEQVPDALSRVRLGSGRDSFGMPTAELDWRLTELDWRSLARSVHLARPGLRAVFGGQVDSLLDEELRPRVTGGSHQMGTTRMSASPRDGVVDPEGRVHGMANLYVAGASVFATGGSANPTLTVVALALRLAGHLRSELAAPLLRAATTSGAPRPGPSTPG